MSVARTRSALYMAARLLGDAQAIKRGRVGQRIVNRFIGRLANRVLAKAWR